MTLTEWATRWGVPAQALAELAATPAFVPEPPTKPDGSESYVQSVVRLEGAAKGYRLWRNNVGAGQVLHAKTIRQLCRTCQDLVRGRPIRWGLANDSSNLNEELKSGDLFGWRRRLITPDMVGTLIAQAVNRECKPVGWAYTGDEHEQAQLRWHYMVLADGGDSAIVTGVGSL